MGKKNRKGASKSKAKKEALAAELKDEQALKQVIRSALYQQHEAASSEAGGEGEKSEPLEGKVQDEAAPKNVLLDFAPFCKYDRRDIDVEINPVEQGPADSLPIFFDLIRRTTALAARITQVAAGTGIHRSHEAEATRESELSRRTGNRNISVLERLPQHFKSGTLELGELIQK